MPPHPNAMTIRKAQYGDLRAMAEVSAAAFMDEELFGGLMHPRRKEYPEDFINFFHQKFLSHWYDPNHHFLVGLDKDSGNVVAVAQWERQGAGAGETSTSWSQYLDSDKFMSGVTSTYLRASNYVWPNKAADTTKSNILGETFPLFSHLWSESESMQHNWFLDFIGIHPDSQGQGIGKELVQWGIAEADRENIAASVISAAGKDGFYAKAGFVEVGRANLGPLRENGIVGGAVMFRGVKNS